MATKHFLSYSSADAMDFAEQLFNAIKERNKSIDLWWDKKEKELRHADNWVVELQAGIKNTEGLIFVMTRDSVHEKSVCNNEWMSARDYKKPIILVKLDHDAPVPLLLNTKQHIDFSNDFDEGLKNLIERLEWLKSPEGKLFRLKDRLLDAERELARSNEGSRKRMRIEEEMVLLQKQIEDQKRIIEDPEGAKKRVEENIKNELKRERQTKEKESKESSTVQNKFIYAPPLIAPAYFQNRERETTEIKDFLQNDAQRLMMVVGESGIGKTALVCRILKSLENGQLPDGEPFTGVDGIVYMSGISSRKINFSNLLDGLCKLLPKAESERLQKLNKTANVGIADKMQELIGQFSQKKVIVLLDNFENKMDVESSEIKDVEVDEMLQILLNAQHHFLKTIITTRKVPQALVRLQPGRQCLLYIDEGLASPYAENLLREMDKGGKFGLKDAPDELLNQAREHTKGNPRALETMFAILSADRNASLEDILKNAKSTAENLEDSQGQTSGTAVEILADEAFNRLDPDDQKVMQALAIYDEPVIPSAVDYLLLPFLAGVDGASVLHRLLESQFVREEEGLFTVSSEYADYALSRIPVGAASDKDKLEDPPFTVFSLQLRAADYWKIIRVPEEELSSVTDLYPQVQEIKLRTKAEDYNAAAGVVEEIFEHLIVAGEYSLIIDTLEPIIDKIRGYDIVVSSLFRLARACMEYTRYYEAIDYFGQALNFAREQNFIDYESLFCGYLGDCYAELGQTNKAFEFYLLSIEIDQEVIKQIDISEYPAMGNHYCKVGECFFKVANYDEALNYFSEANKLSEQANDSAGIINAIMGMADIMVVNEAFQDAIDTYLSIFEDANEIPDLPLQNTIRYKLGVAYLYSGNPQAAMEMLLQALEIVYPPNLDNILTAIGITSLRLGDTKTAKEYFEAAIKEVEIQLKFAEENYDGYYSMGHALAGMSLLDENPNIKIEEALKAYTRAFSINPDYGTFSLSYYLFSSLIPIDQDGILDGVEDRVVEAYDIVIEAMQKKEIEEGVVGAYAFRKTPIVDLNELMVDNIILENNFYDEYKNPQGVGVLHNYELAQEGQIVIDHATNLSWEQSGHEYISSYEEAHAHIQTLNATSFGGFNDWRLPTLEEAMSLMEMNKVNKHNIDPVFDKKQQYIWTADMESPARAWKVDYRYANTSTEKIKGFFSGAYVRAVR